MKTQMAKVVSNETPGSIRTEVLDLNHLLNIGWRVVLCCPMSQSHPTGSSSSALIILERELEEESEKESVKVLGRERPLQGNAARLIQNAA